MHPASEAMAREARTHLLGGVPMAWMTRWPGAFPLFFDEAHGARFTDVDGHEYVDFCLGDTGAMTGHALPQVAEALRRAGVARHHHHAAERPTRPGWAPNWRGASACRCGRWR